MARYDEYGNPLTEEEVEARERKVSAQDIVERANSYPPKTSTWDKIKDAVIGTPQPRRVNVVNRDQYVDITSQGNIPSRNRRAEYLAMENARRGMADEGYVTYGRQNTVFEPAQPSSMSDAEFNAIEMAKAQGMVQREKQRMKASIRDTRAQEAFAAKETEEQKYLRIAQANLAKEDAKNSRWNKFKQGPIFKPGKAEKYATAAYSKYLGRGKGGRNIFTPEEAAIGARKFEKRYRKAYAASSNLGGFFFPMSGLQRRMSQKGMARGRAGRPQGVYKHISPITGQPVHVYVWRKHRDQVRRMNAQKMAMAQQGYATQMMRRGVPASIAFERAQMLQQQRVQQALQETQQAPQQAPQQYQQPTQQYPQQEQQMQPQPYNQAPAPITRARFNPFGSRPTLDSMSNRPQQQAPPGYTEKYDVFTGKKTLIPKADQTERWARDTSSISRPGLMGIRKQQSQGGYY